MAEIDQSAWDGGAAMSGCAQSDDPAAAYEAICAGRREGDPAVQSTWALPHHMRPGMPPNADGVRNSLSRLPQTEGLTNAEEAQRHLDAHMADIQAAAEQGRSEDSPEFSVEVPASDIEVRDLARREIDVRILPWDTAIDTLQGREMFRRGSFAGVPSDGLLLMGLEHEARFGVGQDGRPVLARIPIGRSTAVSEEADGPHATFRVAKTNGGDEFLALAADRVVTHVSAEFREVPGGTSVQSIDGRRTRIHSLVDARAVSPTYRPAYPGADILAVRSAAEESPVTETQEAPVAGAPAIDFAPLIAAINAGQEHQQEQSRSVFEQITGRLEALEERTRASFSIPSGGPSAELPARALRGDWMSAVLRMLSGERVNDVQTRALADLITSDNVGVVPDAFTSEIIGVIDPRRPFLQSTRKLDLPNAGMSLVVPKIVTRPTAGVQAKYGDESFPEKTDITSTATSITNVTFDAITIAGGGDVSLQLLKRSSPSYLSLFLELLAEAYGSNCEAEALASLLDTVGGAGGVNDGGALDPENLLLGDAWTYAAAVKQQLNRMWLSSAAVAKFIDAKADTTNQPLYSNIQAGFTAGGGAQGTISGLTPIYVPELDSTSYDVLVGPSNGFGWTEDGTYTLQVDVPAKAGRDVALVGIVWLAPMYPTAFTAYTIGS